MCSGTPALYVPKCTSQPASVKSFEYMFWTARQGTKRNSDVRKCGEEMFQSEMRKASERWALVERDGMSEAEGKAFGEERALEECGKFFCGAVSAPATKEFFEKSYDHMAKNVSEVARMCGTQDPVGVAVVKHIAHCTKLPFAGVVRYLGTVDLVIGRLADRVHQAVEDTRSEHNHEEAVKNLFGKICSAWTEAGERIGKIQFDQYASGTAARTRMFSHSEGNLVESKVSDWVCKHNEMLQCCPGDLVYFRTGTVCDKNLGGYESVSSVVPNVEVYFHTGRWYVASPIVELCQEGVHCFADVKRKKPITSSGSIRRSRRSQAGGLAE